MSMCKNILEVSNIHEVLEGCRISNGRPCLPCLKHTALEAQALVAKRTLNNLTIQQGVLGTKINQIHDPITRKLPPEIISTIFQFSLPNGWELDSDDPDVHEGGDGEYCDLNKTAKIYGPLFLGAVCRSWRYIAWKTPSLWTVIRIFFQRCPNIGDLQIAADWLDRSGQLPLSIRISEYNNEDEAQHVDADQEEINYLFISLLNQYSSRWDFLDIEATYKTTKFLSKSLNCAPKLRTLSVENAFRQGTVFGAMSGIKPRPSNVWTRSCHLDSLDIQWSHVTSVCLLGIRLEECFMLLQSCPQLTHCRWSINQELESFTLPDGPLVHHVQTMEFGHWICPGYESTWPTVFFDSFNFPKLTAYSFSLTDITYQSVPAHIARSLCALTSFTLDDTACDYESLISILWETPVLHTLILDSVNYGQSSNDLDFMHLLAETSFPNETDTTDQDSKVRFLPNLRYLKFTRKCGPERHRDMFWESIPDIAGPINQIKNPNRRPLNHVRIGWYDTKPPIIRKETALRLLEVVSSGQVVLDLRETHTGRDLLKLSMKRHRIVSKA